MPSRSPAFCCSGLAEVEHRRASANSRTVTLRRCPRGSQSNYHVHHRHDDLRTHQALLNISHSKSRHPTEIGPGAPCVRGSRQPPPLLHWSTGNPGIRADGKPHRSTHRAHTSGWNGSIEQRPHQADRTPCPTEKMAREDSQTVPASLPAHRSTPLQLIHVWSAGTTAPVIRFDTLSDGFGRPFVSGIRSRPRSQRPTQQLAGSFFNALLGCSVTRHHEPSSQEVISSGVRVHAHRR